MTVANALMIHLLRFSFAIPVTCLQHKFSWEGLEFVSLTWVQLLPVLQIL